MRPLTLRLSGLRSYRFEQQIDFSDFSLMAIVGDTGAGKSSILEALCVALYGCCSWDARSAKPLISDGSTTLRVELKFRVGTATWRVTRAISKGAYPPPVHLLESLDDGSRVDGGDQVNAMVSRILGLDFATFLKSVVLPQGRFQILLQMSNTDRTLILKSILGLDQLTAVRDSASDLSTRLRPQLATLQQRRALLLPEPASVAREARAKTKAISTEINRLASIKSKVAAARLAESKASVAANIVNKAADRIDEAKVVGLVEKFKQLVNVSEELEAEAQPIVEEELLLTNLEEEIQQVLDDAAAQRAGLADLAAAAATIVSAIRELPELESEGARCEEEATIIAADEQALAARIAALTEIEIDARRAETDAQSFRAAEKSASLRFEEARASILTARLERQAAVDANLSVVQGRMKVEQNRKEALNTAAHAKAAEQSHALIVEQLNALRRVEAAAHAASACGPGDACPICDRTLPDDFVAPTTPGEDVLVEAYASSEREVKAQNNKAVAATTNLERSVIELDAALTRELVADRRAKDSERDAALLLGVENLDSPDEELLSPLEAAAAAAKVASMLADSNASTKRQDATRADGALQPFSEAIRDRKEALAQALAALSRRITKQRDTLAELPATFGIVGPYGVPVLRAKLAQIETQRSTLLRKTDELSATRSRLTEIRLTEKQFEARRRNHVNRPVEELLRKIERLAERADEAALILDEPRIAQSDRKSLEDELGFVTEVSQRAAELAGKARVRAADELKTAAVARSEGSNALSDGGLGSEAMLEDHLIAAAAGVQIAERDLRTAEEHLPIAADLDTRIGEASPFVDALDELVRLLADSKFVGAVVRRKQRALLGVASELLGGMTNDRFGFAEGFRIVDRLSGQPRDVKTLSGGETFLASLALALALVELAGRAGGRLEALFLDEGFGSLDGNSLSDALEALGRQAEGGRLVAVISHLRAVAENIEHVLLVTKGPSGSEVHPIGAERDALIADELEAGLIS